MSIHLKETPVIQYPIGVDGVTTRVLDSGGQGDLLVMLHGVGSRADRFRFNVEGLGKAGYRAVAVDLPGHGLADKGARPYSVGYYASFVIDLIGSLGADRAGIIGTSLGGHIGAQAALSAPDRITSLVMVGTMGVVPLGQETTKAIARSILDRSRDGIAGKLRFILHRHELITDAWIEEEFRINNSPGADEAFHGLSTYFAENVDDDVVGDRLLGVSGQIPMLLVWGADDEMIKADVGFAAQHTLKDIPLVLLSGTGHVPYLERPDVFNTLIVDFLHGRIPASGTQTI
jgi:pimeloyl-ACP methyl ester carboxylesterase